MLNGRYNSIEATQHMHRGTLFSALNCTNYNPERVPNLFVDLRLSIIVFEISMKS